MLLLAVVVAVLTAALVAQAAVNGASVRKLTAAYTAERANLLAALVARTPGEYAGLLATGRPRKQADPERQVDPMDLIPEGL